ncbi:MAG TPA: hypothetical protein VK447_15360 [Myxococcaceae bacterium]|nr:hypothetical protein [Myxococcaceae bacterium]
MPQILWTRFLMLLALFVPALAFAQAQAGPPRADWSFAWLLALALAILLSVAIWAWTRRIYPPRKLGP